MICKMKKDKRITIECGGVKKVAYVETELSDKELVERVSLRDYYCAKLDRTTLLAVYIRDLQGNEVRLYSK